jgi:hypothetical protein
MMRMLNLADFLRRFRALVQQIKNLGINLIDSLPKRQ